MPRRSLAGKRVVVTGATQGLGGALCRELSRAGSLVLAVGDRESELASLANDLHLAGQKLLTMRLNITDPVHRTHLLQAVRDQFGGLDLLVNSTDLPAAGQFLDLQPESLRAVFETNLFAVAELMRLFIPNLTQGHQPLIVNVSSVLGRRAMPLQSAYSASKFAVQGLSDAVRAELAKAGIGILVVNAAESGQMTAEEWNRAAKTTLKAIVVDKAEITLTLKSKLLVLATRFAPWLVDRIAARLLRQS
jgi:NAD(P)-dependent dehydrogenase (short-subunit alcohol dehydrogenase family)